MAVSGIGAAADEPIQAAENNSTSNAAIAAASVQSSSPTITETRITTNSSDSYNLAIHGNKIVWQDWSNGNWDIYIQDLSTKEQTHITNTGDQYCPDIYGNSVVWTDSRNGGSFDQSGELIGSWDIYLQDLSTKKQTRITTSGSAWYPVIYDNKIVWEDYKKHDIYMYDLSTHKETRISTSGSADSPAIYGNRIVWEDGRNGYYDIYMYDLSTHKETQITTNGFNQGVPDVYGDKIVWIDERNDNGDVYIYDLATKKEKRITIDEAWQWDPAIYGSKIVWQEDWSNVFMYDISTATKTQITTSGCASEPAIYDNKIVWTDDRNGNYDIYMATISQSLPVAAFSVSPTSGHTPLKVAFTDKSTGSPTSWKWSFGDGTYSTFRNSSHTYNKAGKYTVYLTAKNAKGSNTKIISGYITVKK